MVRLKNNQRHAIHWRAHCNQYLLFDVYWRRRKYARLYHCHGYCRTARANRYADCKPDVDYYRQ